MSRHCAYALLLWLAIGEGLGPSPLLLATVDEEATSGITVAVMVMVFAVVIPMVVPVAVMVMMAVRNDASRAGEHKSDQ